MLEVLSIIFVVSLLIDWVRQMIGLNFTIESKLLTKRGHNQMMKVLLIEAMQYQRWTNLPQHFGRNAKTAPGGAYHYRKRTAKYMRRKARKWGHQDPMRFSGRLEQVIQSNTKITATSSRATMRTRGYFPMKTEFRQELEIISRDEVDHMKSEIKRKYVEYAKLDQFQDYVRKR